MTTINDTYVNALLADAAYVDGLLIQDSRLEEKLTLTMTQPQAAFIAANFSVAFHIESTTGSGFDATVWKGNVDTPYAERVYVSMRGTAGIADLLSDVDLTAAGAPRAQYVDMVNWWLRITAPSNLYVRQIRLASGLNGIYFESAGAAQGTGELAGVSHVEVTGHSLGGHLSSAFARIFGARVGIDQITTFNSAGFNGGSETIFAQLQTLLNTGATGFLSSVQTNVFAEHGLNVTTNSFFIDQIGRRQSVFNEEGTGLPNHSMYKLTDTLALANVMGILYPSLSLQDVNTILNAAAAVPAKSLERILDAFRKLAGAKDTTPTIIGDAGDSAPSRIDFHEKLESLIVLLTEDRTLRGTVISLATLTAADLQAAASNPDALATRHALKELNPFAVIGDDGLYAKFNLNHELDLFNSDTEDGKLGRLTSKWIEDRSKMLAAVITADTADSRSGNTLVINRAATDTVLYTDMVTGIALRDGQTVLNPKRITFGSEFSESLRGSDLSDHLYGNAGADTLDGNAGADYLEGGTGNDTLRGGAGFDTYRIDKTGGRDTLYDSDGQGKVLYNGAAFAGTLVRDGVVRNIYHSATHPELNIRFIGNLNERGNLVVIDPNGARFVLMDWKSGELGLTLADSTDTRNFTDIIGTPPGDNSELTVAGHGETLTSTAAGQRLYGYGGSDLIQLAHADTTGYGGAGNDIITNGAGSETLYGEDGNDILIASSGDDILDGGIGDDALQGGADDDLLEGGDGMDLLDGGQGSDVIKGGVGDDVIFGGGNLTVSVTRYESARDYQHFADGQVDMLRRDSDGHLILPTLIGVSPTNANSLEAALTHVEGDGADAIDAGEGDDLVFAGDGDDIVEGGAGKDILVGDAGNDFMTGGSEDDILYGDGAQGDFVAPAGSEGLLGWTLDAFHGDDYLDGGDGNDFISGDGGADELFGGAGDDRLIGDSDHVAVAWHGNDYLDGEAGNDKLWGYGGDDTLFGGTGDDRLEGDSAAVAYDKHGNDYLDGEDGNDVLLGDGGDDTLFGGAGNDELHGDAGDVPLANQGADTLDGEDGDDYLNGYGGDDVLLGGAGNDILQGGVGNDTLTGGTGIDLMEGGTGDDIYVFNAGDGPQVGGTADGIVDTAGNDTLRFGAGIALANITASRANANDLLLDIGTDRLLIEQGLAGALENFELADGTRLSYSQFVGRTLRGSQALSSATPDAALVGGSDSDTLTASGGRARVSGGQGNDTLLVLGNDNTILYETGDGSDQVATPGDTGNGNVLRIAGVSANDIRLELGPQGELVIQVGTDASDTILFSAFDPANVYALQAFDHIEFDDGSTLGYAALMQRGFDIDGSSAADGLSGTNVVDRINGNAGADTLTGGAGNDTLTGGEGADTYVFAAGSGADTVIDGGADTNTLRFESWQTPASLRAARDGADLKLIVRGSADSVTLKDYYAGPAQNWTVDFGGKNAVALTAILAQPDDATTAIQSLWADMKADLALRSIQDGQLQGWSYQGNLVFDDSLQHGSLSRAEVTHQTATTTQYAVTFYGSTIQRTLLSSDTVVADDTRITDWGLGGTNPSHARCHLTTDRIDSNAALIVDDSTSHEETLTGTALATLTWQGALTNYQHSTWNTVSFMANPDGGPDLEIHTDYELDSYERAALVTTYTDNLAGWTAPPGQVVGNRAAVNYQQRDSYVPMSSEVVAGDAANEIHAASGAQEFVDGGAGNDTIYGGLVTSLTGARSYPGDLLYGNSGDDVIYGDGAVMAGGDGSDRLCGGFLGDSYVTLSADEAGIDLIEDRGSSAGAFQNWYYQQSGTSPDEYWQVRRNYEGTASWQTFYSLDAAQEYMTGDGFAVELVHFAGPEAPLLGDSKDYRLLERGGFNTQQDVVELPAGVLQADLTFAWGSNTDENGTTRATLDVAWHGATKLRIVMPRADDPIGFGIDYLKFADGNMLWMSSMIDLAPPMPDMGDGTLLGNWQDDALTAEASGGHLFGMSGNDTLTGGAGSDVLDGGYGNDVLNGGAGNDLYVFRRGDGQDSIVDDATTAGNVDTVLFAQGINPGNVTVSRVGADLVLAVNGTNDHLTVRRGFDKDGLGIEQVKFLSGTTWDADYLASRVATPLGAGNDYYIGTSGADDVDGLGHDDILFGRGGNDVLHGGDGYDQLYGEAGDDELHGGGSYDVLMGGAGEDVLYGGAGSDILNGEADADYLDGGADGDSLSGGAGNDTLRGGLGNDVLRGGAGNDIYVFNLGDGHDVIVQNDWSDPSAPGDIDVVRFGEGIAANDVSRASIGMDLVLTIASTGETLTLWDWRNPSGTQINRVEFNNGNVWDAAALAAMAARIDGDDDANGLSGTELADVLAGFGGNDQLMGNAGDDVLRGGTGDDILLGGSGSDVYVFAPGDGHDVMIQDDAAAGDIDIVRFDAGIAPEDVRGASREQDLVLTISATGETLTLAGWRSPSGARISSVGFDDGSVWNEADLVAMEVNIDGNDDSQYLPGTDQANGIFGYAGNDQLIGMAGDDTLYGGAGDDYMAGGAGNDMYHFGRGDGHDLLDQHDAAVGDVDRIRFAAGIALEDVVARLDESGSGIVLTLADTGDSLTLLNWLYPSSASIAAVEFVTGETWDRAALLSRAEVSVGSGGNDLLVGTSEHTLLDGGAGDDTYLVGADAPVTHIVDSDGTDTLVLGGLTLADISLGVGSLKITVNASGHEIHLDDFDPNDPYAGGGIEYFRFADGALLSKGDVINALGFHPTGGSGDDNLSGTSVNDVISGLAGNDILLGRAGDDVLIGGEGNDSYLFGLGDGNDMVIDSTADGTANRLVLGAGIVRESLWFEADPSGLRVHVGAADSLLLQGWNPAGGEEVIREFEFSDGSRVALAELANREPVAALALDPVSVLEDSPFAWTIPQDAFQDPDVGDQLSYAVTAIDGGALPAWLSFDPVTRSLSGTPGNDDVGSLTAWVTATDRYGKSASSGFDISVQNVNDASTGKVGVGGTATQGQTLSANNTLADDDGLGTISYQWQASADGSTWTDIDGAVGEAFTLSEAQIGKQLRVNASYIDGRGTTESVTSDATVAIASANHAPTLVTEIADQAVTEDFAFAFTVPPGSFADTDAGDALSYSATLLDGAALPAWLAFDAATRTFSGTPTATAAGLFNVRVTATDLTGAGVSDDFVLDVANHMLGTSAANSLFGTAVRDVIEGLAGNDMLNGGFGADTLIGGLGNDIYLVDTLADVVIERAAQGTDTVQSTVNWTLGENLENLTLLGTDGIDGAGNELNNILTGNSAANTIWGGLGNDTLNGGAGADILVGGLGNDIHVVDDAADVAVEYAAEGTDTVRSTVCYTLGANIEYLTLMGVDAIDGTGNELNNVLTGNMAANRLEGGLGNDTYVIADDLDLIIENAAEGTDRVQSTVSHVLGANLENLTLTGIAAIDGIGNELDNVLTGNAATNTLSGGIGNDTLNGGAGADILMGGIGNDVYVFDHLGDVATENADEGTDTVRSYVTGMLGANLENLSLLGTIAIHGTGNELSNVITGNSAANALVGGAGNDTLNGALGADTLIGGLGDDTYTVDNVDDAIIELADEGQDSVSSSVSYALAANIERLVLTGSAGIGGAGNDLDNVLSGNSAANVLSGGAGNDTLSGGSGADTLIGGLDDDTYVVDNAGDVVIENAGEGIDLVRSSVTHTLAAEVENLTLSGTAGIGGTGNALDNIITGTTGNNTLSGNAGNDTLFGMAGADVLIGGTGNDSYALGRGYGSDTVRENDATAGNTDTAGFLAGIAADQIWLRHVGNNLQASIIGTTDKLTLENWYLGSAYHVEQFRTADGRLLLDSHVENLVQAMAAFAPPAAGQTSLPPAYQEALAPVIAANWQ